MNETGPGKIGFYTFQWVFVVPVTVAVIIIVVQPTRATHNLLLPVVRLLACDESNEIHVNRIRVHFFRSEYTIREFSQIIIKHFEHDTAKIGKKRRKKNMKIPSSTHTLHTRCSRELHAERMLE